MSNTLGRGECPLCGIEVSGVRDENDRFLPIRGAGHLDSCLYSKSMMGELEKTGPKRLRRVYLESPWAGDTVTNYAYAIRAMLDCLRRGEAPFASHIFYAHSGVLDDLVPAELDAGGQSGDIGLGELGALHLRQQRQDGGASVSADHCHLGRVHVELLVFGYEGVGANYVQSGNTKQLARIVHTYESSAK